MVCLWSESILYLLSLTKQELPFCGHGTLAAANTVFDYFPQRNEITFHAKPGRLTATRVGQKIQLRVPGLAIDHEIPLDAVELVAALTSVTSLTPSDVINTATFAWCGRCVIFELRPECDLAKQDVNGAKLVRVLSEASANASRFSEHR